MGEIEPEELEASWRMVMGALLAGGVDGLIIETMTALDELLLGVRLAKSLGAPLVVASMSYDPVRGGRVKTMMGVSPEEAARAAVDGRGGRRGGQLRTPRAGGFCRGRPHAA